ncbi:hypothetical protein COJ96_15375 [Bacillus sp. AFS073361]|nr:hypothetical protein COJ96_15375 [Bacillus sp. AFS073361]
MRLGYVFAVILTIILGLASRKFSQLLPILVAENAGDALWAMMVYFGFRFLLVRKSLLTAIILSLLFSYGIEFSQLYQAEWINHLRGTLIGALILGQGFLTVDLIRYAIGIMVAAVIDKMTLSAKKR